jgi:hypothetical protein
VVNQQKRKILLKIKSKQQLKVILIKIIKRLKNQQGKEINQLFNKLLNQLNKYYQIVREMVKHLQKH